MATCHWCAAFYSCFFFSTELKLHLTEPIFPLTREQTNRFMYLCDLLYGFCLQHNFRSHFYVMSSNILVRVATLLKARDKHLRHAAFRIFRLLLKQNNPNMHAQVIKHDVIKPILDLTLQESRRDNLLSCSCQEYFEIMRRDNMKDMIKFCMAKHEPEIRKLAETPLGGQRFQLLIRRWEMNNEPLPPETKSLEKPPDTRWPGQGRTLDAEEEDYFNAEDDEEDYFPTISQQTWSRGGGASSPMPMNVNGLKRKRRMGIAAGSTTKGPRQQNLPPLRASPLLGQLVDYDEDEDDLGDDLLLKSVGKNNSNSTTSTVNAEAPPSSPKLAHRQISLSPSNGPPPPPLKRSPNDDDEEDNLLEALVRPKSRPESPAPGMMASMTSLGPMRPSEKRRRDDGDDDDELLERLSKAKKPDLGSQKGAGGGAVTGRTSGKNGDDPPKRLKLKLGSSLTAAATNLPTMPTTTASKTSAKDGDTG